MKVVVDTSVLMSAIIGPKGPSREVVRKCLAGKLQPQISSTLILEYEDVANRESILSQTRLSLQEVNELVDALFSVANPVKLYFAWRPNLRDEGDNHVIVLCVASGANLITNNIRDFGSGDLLFPGIDIYSPATVLEQWRESHGNINN